MVRIDQDDVIRSYEILTLQGTEAGVKLSLAEGREPKEIADGFRDSMGVLYGNATTGRDVSQTHI